MFPRLKGSRQPDICAPTTAAVVSAKRAAVAAGDDRLWPDAAGTVEKTGRGQVCDVPSGPSGIAVTSRGDRGARENA